MGRLSEAFARIPDCRAEHVIDDPLPDTLMSGFALMFFQHPSLLQFQRMMKQKRKRCHLESIFKVTDVPSDTREAGDLGRGAGGAMASAAAGVGSGSAAGRLGEPVQDQAAQWTASRRLRHTGVGWP